jgi:hypothetical protein
MQHAPCAGGVGHPPELVHALFGPNQWPVQAENAVTEQVLAPAASVTQQAPVGGGGWVQLVAEQALPGPRQWPLAASHAASVVTLHVEAPLASVLQQAPVAGVGQEFAPQVEFGPRHRPWQAWPVVNAHDTAPAESSVQHAPVGGGGGGHEVAHAEFGPRHTPWAVAQSANESTVHPAAPVASVVQQAPVGGGGGTQGLVGLQAVPCPRKNPWAVKHACAVETVQVIAPVLSWLQQAPVPVLVCASAVPAQHTSAPITNEKRCRTFIRRTPWFPLPHPTHEADLSGPLQPRGDIRRASDRTCMPQRPEPRRRENPASASIRTMRGSFRFLTERTTVPMKCSVWSQPTPIGHGKP